MRTASRWFAALLGVCLVDSAVSVQAGPLPLDGNAMGGANQGIQGYFVSIGPFVLSAEVEFAVYEPGNFDLSFGAGADPSGGSDYVYAYQVYNTGAAPASDRQISVFTVAVPPEALGANIGWLADIPFGDYGADPDNASFSPSSARFDYTISPLALGANSDILLFTSPYGPTLRNASVQGGGLSNTHPLPSPVPEPGTLVLLAVAGLVATWARRRLHRR